jgi:hypothetical protein
MRCNSLFITPVHSHRVISPENINNFCASAMSSASGCTSLYIPPQIVLNSKVTRTGFFTAWEFFLKNIRVRLLFEFSGINSCNNNSFRGYGFILVLTLQCSFKDFSQIGSSRKGRFYNRFVPMDGMSSFRSKLVVLSIKRWEYFYSLLFHFT